MGPGPQLLMHSAATATVATATAATAMEPAGQQHEEAPRELVYTKMERLVREMQHPESGVPVRSQKMFLSSIPYAFTGFDIVEWLMDRLGIDDYPEAVHLANLLCQHGYFFPVSDTKTLALKDDHALYRFQTPYFWPSHHQPDNTDYAIFLSKRSLRSKQKHALEEYEQEALNRLKKLLCHKWEFISMQAEEQANLAKERKKTDKVVLDSQERAYWRVHRPPPGYPNCLEKSPVMNRKCRRRKNKEDLAREVERLKQCLNRASSKTSQAVGSLINRYDSYAQFDPFMCGQSCNPWISDDTTLWALNGMLVDVATEKRVRRWALGLGELLADATGVREFQLYLKKEYSEENLRFWQAVRKLRQGSQQDVAAAAQCIYEEHLLPGAPYEVNLDSKTVERIQEALAAAPSRYTFDAAQGQVYALMEKDTYPRFLRSDHYQHLLLNAQLQHPHKKKFFHFGGTGGKKSSKAPLSPQQQPKRPQGASGLSGSHVDLSAASKQEMRKGSSSEVFEWPFCGRHSHSTSDLHNLDAMAKLTSSSRLSSPATSRECVLSDSTRATTLQVPRLSHRSSEDGSSSPEEGSSLSLPVPPVGPTAKNIVAPWEENP